MSRCCLVAMVFALCSLSLPARDDLIARDSTPISPINAGQLRILKQIDKRANRFVHLSAPGELVIVPSFSEQPAEVVDEMTGRSIRKMAADRKLILFTASKTGRHLAWSENNTCVHLQEVASGETLQIETGNAQPGSAFSPDGKLLASGGYGTQVKLWDLTGQLVRALDAGVEGGLTPVFSPDGKLLAVGNRNDHTSLYEVATWKLLHTLPRRMTQEIAFSPDGKVLAAGYVDGTVALWDTANGALVHSEQTGGKETYTLDWTPKGDVLVTAGLEGKIVLWDSRKLTVLKELDAPEWVIQARFTRDGSRLLTSGGSAAAKSTDRKITIWALAD